MKTIIRILKALGIVLSFMLCVILGIWLAISLMVYYPVPLVIVALSLVVGTIYNDLKEKEERNKR